MSLPENSDVITALQHEIAAWADGIFPDRTAYNALSKLMLEEIPELISGKLNDPHEFADVVILVLDIAYLQGIDIGKAVREKMDINRRRVWDVDRETGLLHHLFESED